MRPRTFIAALGSAAAARPFAIRAQQRIPRIGYLGPTSADLDAPLYNSFRAGLRDIGYVEGENLELETRFSDGDEERLVALAKELVALKVDVIVTGGLGVYPANKTTTTVPIVATVAPDLVALGLAESLAHPGGNVTGQVSFVYEVYLKRIALLKEVKPAMRSVGLLVMQGVSTVPALLRGMDAPLIALGIGLQLIEVAGASDCDRALSAGPGASIDGLVPADVPQLMVGPGPGAVAAAAMRHGLPSAGASYFARNGGLLGYGVDLAPMFRRAAVFVDKILKGAKPGVIPIEQATTFHFVVNLKTAKALSLAIPPTLLAAADEVIE